MSFLVQRGYFNKSEKYTPEYCFGGTELFVSKNVKILKNDDVTVFVTGTILEPDDVVLENLADISSIAGTYAYVKVNNNDNTLVVGTEKMGFFPVYYSRSEDHILCGISLPHLKYRLKVATPNYEAWNELLNTGDILGSHTVIQEIQRLLPGEKIVISRTGETKLVRDQCFSTPLYADAHSYIKENNRLLNECISKIRIYSDSLLLPLTAGGDSRRLAAALYKNRFSPRTLTQAAASGEGVDIDTAVASDIAKRLGWEHEGLPQPDACQLQLDFLEKDYWTGFESFSHYWAINMNRSLESSVTLIDGIVGDVTINNHYFKTYPELINGGGSYSEVAETLTRDDILFKFKPSVVNVALPESVEQELRKYDFDANVLTKFKIFNHTRRNTGSWLYPFILSGHDIVLPYSYLPLFKQSLSLLPEEKKGFFYNQQNCLREEFFDIAELPSTRDDLPIEYWVEAYNPKPVLEVPAYTEKIKIRQEVFDLFERDAKTLFLDKLCESLPIRGLRHNRRWRRDQLKRLSFFLDWLETDESGLPPLFYGIPPIIENYHHKI